LFIETQFLDVILNRSSIITMGANPLIEWVECSNKWGHLCTLAIKEFFMKRRDFLATVIAAVISIAFPVKLEKIEIRDGWILRESDRK